jgi:hypothetical protein
MTALRRARSGSARSSQCNRRSDSYHYLGCITGDSSMIPGNVRVADHTLGIDPAQAIRLTWGGRHALVTHQQDIETR